MSPWPGPAGKGGVWGRVLRARSDLTAARSHSETVLGMVGDVAAAVTAVENAVAECRAEL
jgi:hypothetical protein